MDLGHKPAKYLRRQQLVKSCACDDKQHWAGGGGRDVRKLNIGSHRYESRYQLAVKCAANLSHTAVNHTTCRPILRHKHKHKHREDNPPLSVSE